MWGLSCTDFLGFSQLPGYFAVAAVPKQRLRLRASYYFCDRIAFEFQDFEVSAPSLGT